MDERPPPRPVPLAISWLARFQTCTPFAVEQLLAYAHRLPERIYEPGRLYVKAGVVLDGLEPPDAGRAQQLTRTLDSLNQQFGRGTVRPAATITPVGQPAPWQGNARHKSPAYTTRFEDLLVVR